MCAPISIDPSPQEIVLGRLDEAIRRLFGATASIRFLYNEEYRLSEGGETVAFAYIRYTTTLQPFPTSRKAVFLHLPIQRKWLYHTPHKAVFLYHQETKERSRSP